MSGFLSVSPQWQYVSPVSGSISKYSSFLQFGHFALCLRSCAVGIVPERSSSALSRSLWDLAGSEIVSSRYCLGVLSALSALVASGFPVVLSCSASHRSFTVAC